MRNEIVSLDFTRVHISDLEPTSYLELEEEYPTEDDLIDLMIDEAKL